MRVCRQQWRLYAYVYNCDGKNTVSQISTEIRCANVVTCEYVCLYLCCSRVCHQFACTCVLHICARRYIGYALLQVVHSASSANTKLGQHRWHTCMRIQVRRETPWNLPLLPCWLEISSLSILTYFKSDEISYLFANRNE